LPDRKWKWGPVPTGLFQQQFVVAARRKADQADLIRQILRDLDGAGADAAGAAEKNDVFHQEKLTTKKRRNKVGKMCSEFGCFVSLLFIKFEIMEQEHAADTNT
jgi:hypothetical protein